MTTADIERRPPRTTADIERRPPRTTADIERRPPRTTADIDRGAFLISSLLDRSTYVHGFSTRLGGVSEGEYSSLNLGDNVGDNCLLIKENLRNLMTAMEVADYSLATLNQVHGDRILVLKQGKEKPFDARDGDALITAEPGWMIGIRTADCVPILLAGSGVVAAVHAGWRGTVARIVFKVVRRIEAEFGVAPADLSAAIGPAIGVECYTVGNEVVEGLESTLASSPGGVDGVVRGGEGAEFYAEREKAYARSGPMDAATGEPKEGNLRVDLKEANRRLLLEAGVLSSAIDVFSDCVCCESELFFSHRRDFGKTGRMLNLIGLRG